MGGTPPLSDRSQLSSASKQSKATESHGKTPAGAGTEAALQYGGVRERHASETNLSLTGQHRQEGKQHGQQWWQQSLRLSNGSIIAEKTQREVQCKERVSKSGGCISPS